MNNRQIANDMFKEYQRRMSLAFFIDHKIAFDFAQEQWNKLMQFCKNNNVKYSRIGI